MKSCFLNKTLTAAMAAMLACSSLMAVPVFAAKDSTDGTNNKQTQNDLADSDIIDMSKTGSLTIYKYDITAAQAAGAYHQGDRVASGEADAKLEEMMKDYALEGVEFTYMRVGNIETYSNTKDTQTNVEVVYEIPTALAEILKLDAGDAYDMTEATVAEPCHNEGVLHYTSTQLTEALQARLDKDALSTRSDLAEYLVNYGMQSSTVDEKVTEGAVQMPKTDENGRTHVDGLKLGLYLLVETEVPEQVTDTTNPWFVSLPFTNYTDVDGDKGGQEWLYDMTVYPKNQTGNPTLDKSVRNAYSTTAGTAGEGTFTHDKNGTINAGERYDYNEADGSGALVVHNDEHNTDELSADTDDKAYVANRGGYVNGDGTVAGEGQGADYSYDYEYRDTTTASAGDVLDYILVSKLPRITDKATFLSQYQFTDILSEGLTYNKDVKIAFYDNKADAAANNTRNAVTIWANNDGQHSEYFETVTETDPGTGMEWTNGAEKMEVIITEEGLNALNGEGVNGTNIAGQGAGQVSNNSYSDLYMVVYYTATVNSDDTLVVGDDGNPNNVVLKWQRTSDVYFNTLEDRNYVYAYEIDLTKHFSDEKGNFEEVKFKLYNNTDSYYVIAEYNEEANVYYVTGKTIHKEEATDFIPHEGSFVIYGLEADSYELTEVATDNGYTLLEDTINVVITPTDRDIQASVAGVTGMDEAAMDAIIAAYQGGIYNENGVLVNASVDEIFGENQGARPAVEDANGRTIGKTDMFIGEIKPATATVDGVDAEMKEHTYTPGNKGEEATSENAIIALDVVNNKNFILPATGGTCSILLVVGGCAALAGGAIVATRRKAKKAGSEE